MSEFLVLDQDDDDDEVNEGLSEVRRLSFQFEFSLQHFVFQEVVDEIESSVREGAGKILFPSGNQYEGEFHAGLRHGRGVFQFINGARYDGEWRKGSRHGLGKFIYPDGSCYCGDWKFNKKHGVGKYFYGSTGDIYDGAWKDDVKHGMGTYKYNEVHVVIKAAWIKGSIKGPIEIFYPNFRFHGYWNDDGPVGEGAFSFGMKYLLPGHFENYFKPIGDDSTSFETSKAKSVNQVDNEDGSAAGGACVSRFVAHEIQPYEYKKLPQQPMPIPREDSIVTLCTQSSKSGSSDVDSSCNDNYELQTTPEQERDE